MKSVFILLLLTVFSISASYAIPLYGFPKEERDIPALSQFSPIFANQEAQQYYAAISELYNKNYKDGTEVLPYLEYKNLIYDLAAQDSGNENANIFSIVKNAPLTTKDISLNADNGDLYVLPSRAAQVVQTLSKERGVLARVNNGDLIFIKTNKNYPEGSFIEPSIIMLDSIYEYDALIAYGFSASFFVKLPKRSVYRFVQLNTKALNKNFLADFYKATMLETEFNVKFANMNVTFAQYYEARLKREQ